MKTALLLSAFLALAVPVRADDDLDPDSREVQPAQGAAVAVDLSKEDLDALEPKKVVAKLQYPGGSKDVTVEDVIALALVVHAETWGNPTEEDASAMIWSLAQRTYWSPTWNKKSLKTLCYAYSQPINPIWREGGKKCPEAVADDKSDACSEHRLKKRKEFAELKWKDLAENAKKAAAQWASGKLPNPVVGSVGWLAKGEWGKDKETGEPKEKHPVYNEVKKTVAGETKRVKEHVGDDVKLYIIKNNVFNGHKRLETSKQLDSVDYDGSEAVVVAPDGTKSTVAKN